MQLGQKFCANPDDHWEYMLIHGLSRHYPFTNLSSMGTVAEQRTIAFDNDIYNLYLSLPKSHRIDGKIAKQTLKILSPQLAAIPTANTNQRPNQSALARDTYRLVKLLQRYIWSPNKGDVAPTAEERTWPDRGRMFNNQPLLKNAAIQLQKSEAIASLGFVDMDKLVADIPGWVEKPNDGSGALLTFLITIDRFLKTR